MSNRPSRTLPPGRLSFLRSPAGIQVLANANALNEVVLTEPVPSWTEALNAVANSHEFSVTRVVQLLRSSEDETKFPVADEPRAKTSPEVYGANLPRTELEGEEVAA